MTAADHLAFWEARERADSKRARKKRGRGFRTAADDALLVLPLHDRTNLDLFLLMEEFADFPAARVTAEPVMDWPAERLEDFRRIRVARREVGRKWGRLRKADSYVREVMDAMVSEVKQELKWEDG